jgi:hypothetical protein
MEIRMMEGYEPSTDLDVDQSASRQKSRARSAVIGAHGEPDRQPVTRSEATETAAQTLDDRLHHVDRAHRSRGIEPGPQLADESRVELSGLDVNRSVAGKTARQRLGAKPVAQKAAGSIGSRKRQKRNDDRLEPLLGRAFVVPQQRRRPGALGSIHVRQQWVGLHSRGCPSLLES